MENRGLIPSIHQAAGHDGHMVSGEDSRIFVKATNEQEVEFYNRVQEMVHRHDDPTVGTCLGDWVPVYLGLLQHGKQEHLQGDAVKLNLLEEDADKVDGIDMSAKIGGSEGLAGPDGVTDAEGKIAEKQYIVLQNLYHGFEFPSILDIKLGSVLHDVNAGEEKITRLTDVSNSTTSGSLGFRICGMKVYQGCVNDIPTMQAMDLKDVCKLTGKDDQWYVEYNKFFGRRLCKYNVKEGLSMFFGQLKDEQVKAKLVLTYIKRLQLLYNCLLDTEVRIISGSLLLIFENSPKRWNSVLRNIELFEDRNPLVRSDFFDSSSDEEDQEISDLSRNLGALNEDNIPLSSLSMIDFAHAKFVPGQGYDENVVEGIENLLKLFEEIYIDLTK